MKRKKIEPAVQQFWVKTPTVSGGQVGQYYLDLSQIASLVNRRFYRQGLNWAVGGIKLLTSVNGTVYVNKLPNTWTMSNAWQKGFSAWQRMNREAMEETESIRPKFLDFKIHANSRHHEVGFAANLLPKNIEFDKTGGATVHDATAGEWDPSQFVVPISTAPGTTLTRDIIAVGGNYPGAAGSPALNAVSLIEGYAASRALPDVRDPNVPADAADARSATAENWLSQIFNEGTDQTDDVITDLIQQNNIAPYPFENDGVHTDTMYPGGANQLPGLELHDVQFITGTTIGGTSRIKGGNFPCGLVEIAWEPSESGDLSILVEMVPGPHRGYLAMPMQEM